MSASVPTTNLPLLESLRNLQDSCAWQLFVELYTPFLYRVARAKCADDSTANELVQDAFLRCALCLPAFQHNGKGRFHAFLRTIVANLARDHLRKGARRPPAAVGGSDMVSLLNQQAGHEIDPAQKVLSSDQYERMFTAIRQVLNEDQWAIFRLTWIEEVSTQEIATQLGKTLGAIRLLQFRVRGKLKELGAALKQTDDV